MKIYSLTINDEINNIHPVYEVHTWEKAEEIIRQTMALVQQQIELGYTNNGSFSFEVSGFVRVGE